MSRSGDCFAYGSGKKQRHRHANATAPLLHIRNGLRPGRSLDGAGTMPSVFQARVAQASMRTGVTDCHRQCGRQWRTDAPNKSARAVAGAYIESTDARDEVELLPTPITELCARRRGPS